LKKDPRAYETCNCNESAAKLKKQFRTLISHILSLIQIDYIIKEEGLKIEQLNEADVFFVDILCTRILRTTNHKKTSVSTKKLKKSKESTAKS
jgi:hypothetical protein